MGWASGSILMDDIIRNLKKVEKDPKKREVIYGAIIPPFEAHDCDTLSECNGDPAFQRALKAHWGLGY